MVQVTQTDQISANTVPLPTCAHALCSTEHHLMMTFHFTTNGSSDEETINRLERDLHANPLHFTLVNLIQTEVERAWNSIIKNSAWRSVLNEKWCRVRVLNLIAFSFPGAKLTSCWS